ncbi:glycosyltransferase family 39 protein [Microcoleus sp. FACHB-672]|uniref:glycosyltransferase family 39 protein n=1 Tax=Microcoleus sp. FACHB-672 TaxID=2692825 RepID=UPI00168895B0|nr:glycosyltransferase family 39 protein [Microcoleus sp. FACHB-672]
MKFKVNHTIINFLKSCQKHPAMAWTLSVLWLFLICWLAFLWNLGKFGLIDETEPLFAEAARQMTVTGDWITPYFNEETRFDKPPLIYWLMAIFYKIIGVNEWAVRLPSALSAIALAGLGFYTLRYFTPQNPFSNSKLETEPAETISENLDAQKSSSVEPAKPWLIALIGSSLIALNPETIAWARVGVSDMLLTGCMGSALLAFFIGYAKAENNQLSETHKKKPFPWNFILFTSPWYLTFYILAALAILAKGPVGIVLPALIIAAFLLYLGNFREVLREMRPICGAILMLAIALPWYILVILANGEDYINSFFGYHNLERFTRVVNHHWAPWYFYFVVVLVGFAPWSVYLPVAIARLRFWKRSIWRRQPRSNQLGLFALFWFAVIFGFFTIAVTKLPSYVLPLMPAAAILVALLWGDIILSISTNLAKNQESKFAEITPNESSGERPPNKTKFYSNFLNLTFWLNVAFWALGAGAFFSHVLWLKKVKDPAIPNVAEVIQQSGLLIAGGVIWAIVAGAGAFVLLKRKKRWLWTVNFVGFLAFLIFAMMPAFFLMDRYRQMPLRQLAETVIQIKQPDEELVMIGFEKPSLVFYTQQPVQFFRRATSGVKYIKNLPETQAESTSVLMVGYPSKFEEGGLRPNQYTVLDKAGAYQLVRISKQVVARINQSDLSIDKN